jgi:hypothetical protein
VLQDAGHLVGQGGRWRNAFLYCGRGEDATDGVHARLASCRVGLAEEGFVDAVWHEVVVDVWFSEAAVIDVYRLQGCAVGDVDDVGAYADRGAIDSV